MDNYEIYFNLAPDEKTCMPNKKHNSTIITNVYEGIPETLLLNVIGWVLLLVLFTILRRQAWNYGHMVLVRSVDSVLWTQLFYSHADDPSSITSESSVDSLSLSDKTLCSWLPAIFRTTKQQFLSKCGPDAVHYLSFQKHLIILMSIITTVSLCIALPINFQGNLAGDATSFGHTTLSNLEPDSPWLWSHVILMVLYVPTFILVMRRCSGRVPLPKDSTRTIIASNIAAADRNTTTIRNYIRQLFPNFAIQDVQMAYDTSKLSKLIENWEKNFQARLFCEVHYKKTGQHITVRPDFFSCKKVNGIEYYSEHEARLSGEVERQRAWAISKPLGIAFITVESADAAEHIITHFKPGTYREWLLDHAPAPSDIFWENLSVKTGFWYTKAILINVALFIVLFFLTTPVMIVNMIDKFYDSNGQQMFSKISPVISEFLPTLLLWTMSALLPVLVAYSDQWLSHWTRSRQNLAVMNKCFVFLLIMVLILPSLGLTSAQAFVDWTLQSGNQTYRWECVFLPDKGAFFVNYIITSAFIGTALELIRFPELFMYVWKLLQAKSKAETLSVRKSILAEFPFGVHYAWTLLAFTMSVVYSLACPLITPFALVYLTLKHCSDRHNLYFVYNPSNMSSLGGGRIHTTAVQLVRVGIVLLQMIMAALAVLRGGGIDARAIVLLICFSATTSIFFFLSPFPTCTNAQQQATESTEEEIAPVYIAKVLTQRIVHPDSPLQQLDYGSDSTETGPEGSIMT